MDKTDKSINFYGVFGGAFDPIHLGHIQIANEIQSFFTLKSVLLVPTYRPVLKKKLFASFEHRVNIVNLAIKSNPRLSCSLVEKDLGDTSYIYRTLDRLKNTLPSPNGLYLIIGADLVSEIKDWKNPDKILKSAKIAVAIRKNFIQPPDNPDFKKEYTFVPTSEINISSTMIRSKIKKGEPINQLTGDSVAEYIKRNELYI